MDKEPRNTQGKKWIDSVKYNLYDLRLTVEDTEDRSEWSRRIHVVDRGPLIGETYSLKERERGGCSFLAAYRRACGLSQSAWSNGRRPVGAALHSSREPGELSQ